MQCHFSVSKKMTGDSSELPVGDGDVESPCHDAGASEPSTSKSAAVSEHATLKYSLLGPSLTKAGQDTVDQAKVTPLLTENPSEQS